MNLRNQVRMNQSAAPASAVAANHGGTLYGTDGRVPDPTAGLMARFQPELANVIAGPWQMATGQDLRWPAVGQTRQIDPVTRLVQRYFDRVLEAMTTDGEVAAAFFQVQNMLQPPTTLFPPKVARRVLLSRAQGVSPQPVAVKLSRATLREIAS